MKSSYPRLAALFLFCTIFTLFLGCGKKTALVSSEIAAPDWEILGPGGGGATFFPTFHPTDPQRVAIRCDMTGIYLSDNGGASWKMYNLQGVAQTFAFDPQDSEVVYAGLDGLYRTDNWGGNWELIFPPAAEVERTQYLGDHADTRFILREGSVCPADMYEAAAVLLDPRDSHKVYLGVNRRGTSGSFSSLFISTDRGQSWKESGSLDSPVLGLFCNPGGGDYIYAFTTKTAWRLDRNSGALSSTALPKDLTPLTSVSGGVDPSSGSMRFYAVPPAGLWGEEKSTALFVSEDGGLTWKSLSGEQMKPPSSSAEDPRPVFRYISCSPADSRTAYLVCGRYLERNPRGEMGHWYGIFKTTDAGKTWDWVYKAGGGSSDYTVRNGWNAENESDSWVREAFGGEFISVICTGVFPGNPDIAMFTDWYRTMKTVDGGKTWSEVYSEPLPDGTVKSRGLDVTTCYGVHFDPFDPDHIAVSYTDIAYWHSFDRGRTWSRSVEGVPPEWDNTCYWVQFDPSVKDRLWSVWSAWHDIPRLKMIRNPGWRKRAVGGVCVSTDAGRSWKVAGGGLPENAPTTSLVLEPESPVEGRVLYATVYGSGVYKTADGGASWELKNEGLGQDLNVWEISRDALGRLYLVISNDIIYDDRSGNRKLVYGELYRSTDGAGHWERIALPEKVHFPNSVTADPADPQRLYLSSWASLTAGDYGGRPPWPAPAGLDDPVIEAEGGVVLSEDGGATWRQIFDSAAYVYGLAVDPVRPGRLYVNTFQNAAWLSEDSGKNWKKIKGYDFHWGQRVFADPQEKDKIYLTTFGSSLWHGHPVSE